MAEKKGACGCGCGLKETATKTEKGADKAKEAKESK
jgi:hypothetical protein